MASVEALEAALREGLGPQVGVRAASLDADVPPLLPEEAPYAEPAVRRRRQELAVGRHLARGLLAERGVPPAPLLRREDRTVIWPAGFIGSITHTKDVVAVAVARADEVPWLGIDVELSRVSTNLVSRILRPEEQAAVAGLAEDEVRRRTTVVFSAKEAFYKAQYPHTEVYLGFGDVWLEASGGGADRLVPPNLSGARGRVTARVVRSGSAAEGLTVGGFWAQAGPWIVSGFSRESG